MNLPPEAITTAQLLVGAVRAHDADAARELLDGADLHALAVTLAAFVDDSKTPAELLAWNDGPQWDRMVWRRNLTDDDCLEHHRDFARGRRGQDVEDGEREYQRRRKVVQYQKRKEQAA